MQFSSAFTICDVLKWLKELFQEELDIPDLDGNDELVEVMKKLICLSNEGDKDVGEIIKTDVYLENYYTERNTASICINSLFIQNLSTKDLEYVKVTSSIAVQLTLKQPSLTNFLLSLSFLENESHDHVEEHIINVFAASKYKRKIADLMQKNIITQRRTEPFEKVVSKQQSLKSKQLERLKFLKIKTEEYKKQVKKQQRQLSDLGFTPSLSHSELVKKAEVVQCLESNVKHTTAKLNRYQNLPPNEMLARLKVEELKAKILEKQKEFQDILQYS